MLLPAWSILCTLLPVAGIHNSFNAVAKEIPVTRSVFGTDGELGLIVKASPAIKPVLLTNSSCKGITVTDPAVAANSRLIPAMKRAMKNVPVRKPTLTASSCHTPAVKDTPIIKLVFTMDNRPDNPEADTLFYPSRKLRWTDFRGTPSLRGPSAAVAFTSFAYEGRSRVQRDTLQITLTLQVFFIRSASWARAGIMDSYSLGHEQLHFDITYLVAQRFKQRIRRLPLTRDDYDSMIQYEYLEAFREMNQLQDEYDGETRNGTNTSAQQEWRTRISHELETVNAQP